MGKAVDAKVDFLNSACKFIWHAKACVSKGEFAAPDASFHGQWERIFRRTNAVALICLN